jgi:hypothetical protein
MSTLPREEAVIREGWLLKEGGASRSRWQSRWFVLRGRSLLWFNKPEDSSPQGSLSMADVHDVSQVGDHSGKKHCVTLVTTKASSKKVYYLAAETEHLMREWFAALQAQWLGDKRGGAGIRLVKYATAEVFLTQGVRVTGDVNYGILSTISGRVGPERKRRDWLGWFCDTTITLSAVLNLFSEYGWTPERVYRSTAVAAGDSSLQPVVRVIFSKSPQTEAGSGVHQLESSTALLRSGAFDTVTVSAQPVSLALPPRARTLEGTDDELIELMQEFGIPLSLLLTPSD